MENYDEESREIQKKVSYIQRRVDNAEQLFGNLCMTFGSYIRSLAKCRDRNDKVAMELNIFASNERLSTTTRASMVDFVKNYSAIQDHLDIKIKRIRQNVIQPLSVYESLCRETKKSSRQTTLALKKEQDLIKRISKLQKTRAYQNLLESKISHSIASSTKLKKQFGEQMGEFEKRKLKDLKKMLTAVVSAEIDFSLKSLQFLTSCYKNLEDMDEEADLKQFNEHMHGIMKFGEIHPKPDIPSGNQTLNNTNLRETKSSVDTRDVNGSPKMISFDNHDEDSDEENSIRSEPSESENDDDDDNEYNVFVQPID